MVLAEQSVDEVVIADSPGAWRRAGFDVRGESCAIGSVLVRLEEDVEPRGLLGWSVRGLAETDPDGLPTATSSRPARGPAAPHPNGATAIDHVVAFTPDLDRTASSLHRAGLSLRRVREGPTPGGAERQAFFRLGEVILEVVEHPPGSAAAARPEAPPRLWGLALLVEDLDECARRLGGRLGAIRDAVQPGRRIAPLRRSAGLAVPVAFITPDPGRPAT